MAELKDKRKITREPALYIGKDKTGRWRIQQANGKLHAYKLMFEEEAKEIAFKIAAVDLSYSREWRQYKIRHAEILRSYEIVQSEYL